MTPTDAIELAGEAGLFTEDGLYTTCSEGLADFANLVEERVKERAAKVADERAEGRRRLYDENGASINAAKSVEAEEIASAIRAME